MAGESLSKSDCQSLRPESLDMPWVNPPDMPRTPMLGLKKKNCLFPISDRPYQNMCDPNLFYGFKFFFFF